MLSFVLLIPLLTQLIFAAAAAFFDETPSMRDQVRDACGSRVAVATRRGPQKQSLLYAALLAAHGICCRIAVSSRCVT